MARTKSIGIRKILARLLPRRRLQRLADEAGLTKRKRKVQVHALFWTLVLGFGSGRERSIAGLRRAYQRATRCTASMAAMAASAFVFASSARTIASWHSAMSPLIPSTAICCGAPYLIGCEGSETDRVGGGQTDRRAGRPS